MPARGTEPEANLGLGTSSHGKSCYRKLLRSTQGAERTNLLQRKATSTDTCALGTVPADGGTSLRCPPFNGHCQFICPKPVFAVQQGVAKAHNRTAGSRGVGLWVGCEAGLQLAQI